MDKKKITRQQDDKLPAEHKGMPPADPQPQDELVDKQLTQRDKSSEMNLHLPHERDQSTAMTQTGRSPIIEQAFRDEEQGLEDTSKQPEMNDAYKKLVGGSRSRP